MKRYLLELTPALSFYEGHRLVCCDIAEYLAKYNGNPDRNPNGIDLEAMFKFEFHDARFTGKWLGNTIYEFGSQKVNNRYVVYGRIIEINF